MLQCFSLKVKRMDWGNEPSTLNPKGRSRENYAYPRHAKPETLEALSLWTLV